MLTRQPQHLPTLDRNNRLAEDVQFAWVGSHPLIDVSGVHRPGTIVGTWAGMTAGPMGKSPKFDANFIIWFERDLSLEKPDSEMSTDLDNLGFTWAVAARRTGTLAQYARPFGKTHNNGGSAPYLDYDFEFNHAGEGQDTYRVKVNQGASPTNPSEGSPVTISDATKPFVILATRSNNLYTNYLNGVSQTSTVPAFWTQVYDTDAGDGRIIIAGGSSAAGTGGWIGDIYLAVYWRRRLSPTEIKMFSDNPWQMFVDPRDSFRKHILPVYAAAAGGGSSIAVKSNYYRMMRDV